ncbi:cilium assembly protein DZIP1 isoform X1 [Gouania willdenowi]|uniref:Zinc finger protein Dzip1-like n=1 Tax=Gouania willdenowi TaxID=441366 RepID=A0A8C5NH51_GOUWI|nr:zinc finger protein Dzip1-like isoform X1 [Gouania willdenowi]XP_028326558.1 zinc finger protein Dzip1-like isoform X1 [Gouania willdenowi]XP_028326567.1 zinc finger protein Dzip1-like isoform X1 [Gouania willdenowi]XP_028326575.1 zinc finger protein Dzip1-like isoform X1 [Gouania willdenowi]
MPFHEGVYYPYGSNNQGTPTSAGIPSFLSSVLSPAPPPAMTPSSGAPMVLPFKFRPRREIVDWRRINAVDVDQVVSQVDVDMLQEHINTVTFCNLEGECCLRCRNPVDPALVNLLRLAQLSVEWLLHSQEFLTLNLVAAEERLAAADKEHQQLLEQLKKQKEMEKEFISELKQRKKIIRSQQSLLGADDHNSKKCSYCEKAFLNSSFLQSHIQRRHREEYNIQLRTDTERTSLINSYKSENDSLKSELSRMKEQFEQQRQAFEAKRIQEVELQSQKDLLTEQRVRAEAMAQMERKIADSRDEMRREMEFLLNRNIQTLNEINQNQAVRQEKSISPVHSQPERDVDISKELQIQATQMLEQQIKKQDEKWETRLEEMKALHESEKNKLLDEVSRMQVYMTENREMRRNLQKKEHVIRAQSEEIKTMTSNPTIKVVEVPVKVSSPAPEPKQKRVVLEEPVSALKLDPIQELSEEEKDTSIMSEKRPAERKPEPAPVKKPRVSSALQKKHPDIKKELEQMLVKQLESLGVKSDQTRLNTTELQSILAKVQAKRDSITRRIPNFLHQRKEVVRMVEQRLGERMTGSKSRNPAQVLQIKPLSSSLPSRASQATPSSAMRQSQASQAALTSRSTPQPKTSTPVRQSLTVRTPPFSSDEESDSEMEEEEEPVKHLWGKSSQPRLNQSNLVQAKVGKTNPTPPKRFLGGNATKVESDEEEEAWTDVSELQEIDPRQLQCHRDQNGNVENRNRGKENKINDLARKIEKQSAERVVKKPAGGVSILPGRKDEVQELTFTDLEESSECSESSEEVEEDRHKALKPGALRKSLDSASTSVWGTSSGKAPRSGLINTGTGSTLKSGLGSLSDISDS